MSTHIYIPVHFDGKTFVPDQPVNAPVDQPAVVRLIDHSSAREKSPEERRAALRKLIGMLKDTPEISVEATRRINMYDDERF